MRNRVFAGVLLLVNGADFLAGHEHAADGHTAALGRLETVGVGQILPALLPGGSSLRACS